MSEYVLDRSYQRGNRGNKVKIIQEWLCLNGINILVDGIFGPATEAAVLQFQTRVGIAGDGVVGDITFSHLTRPYRLAVATIPADHKSLGRLIIEYAEQHLVQHPREVGGENKGPWVRLYMNGNEGRIWEWCAGFACFILKQACGSLGRTLPIKPSFSCDSLAADAKKRSIFLKEAEINDENTVLPGSLFLSRRTSSDWTHTGIVTSIGLESFETIEGNTNDEGSHSGYEVCKRIRGYGKKDFILVV